MQKRWFKSPFFIITAVICFVVLAIEAANILGGQKYAEDHWGGIINVDTQQDADSNDVGGITVTDTQITGQIWAQNLGWIEMQPTGITGISMTVTSEDIDGDQTDEIIGRLDGFGWSDLIGPIFFGQWDEDNADADNDDSTGVDDNTGIYIDPEGYFQGVAWSKLYGSLSFGDMMLENSEANIYTDPDDATDAAYDKANYWARTEWVPNIIEFTATSSSDDESVTSVNLELNVPNAPSTQDVTVNYSATGGTAEGSGTDYTLANGTATITATNTTTNINISINNDSFGEEDETIEVTISSPTNAILGTNTVHTYTIIDDDQFLIIDIVDDLDVSVTSPSVALSAITAAFQDQTNTGTLGTSTEKIRLTNTTLIPAWSVTLAATGGNTTLWTGGSETMDYNDTSGAGQFTLNPSVGTVVRDDSGSTSGVTLGSQDSFEQGVTDNITIFSSSTAAINHSYDLTGVSLSQLVPVNQVPESYTINFTLTAS